MIYKIQPDIKNFQLAYIDADSVEETLGEDCLIHMDSRPTKYADIWSTLKIEFYDALSNDEKATSKPIADIAFDNYGRLFLTKKAYDILATHLQNCGEWLSVNYSDTDAYLLNILNTAEDAHSTDIKPQSEALKNTLSQLAFESEAIKSLPVFRTQADSYRGIFCHDEIKNIIEKHQLTGCIFNTDLSDRPPAA